MFPKKRAIGSNQSHSEHGGNKGTDKSRNPSAYLTFLCSRVSNGFLGSRKGVGKDDGLDLGFGGDPGCKVEKGRGEARGWLEELRGFKPKALLARPSLRTW